MITSNPTKSGEKVFYEFFLTHVTSVYDFEKQTGISRADGCRYKSKLEKLGLLQVVRKGVCPVSHERNVQFVTTDKSKFLPLIQLQIDFSKSQP